MGKRSKIALIVIFCVVAVLYASYLFLVPKLVNSDTVKAEVIKAAKSATGLDVNLESIKLDTGYDFSAIATVEGVQVEDMVTLKKLKVKVYLIPLIFNEIALRDILIDDYSVKYKKFAIAGKALKIFEFKPNKFVKLATDGTLSINNEPKINYDLKLASEFPLVESDKKEEQKPFDLSIIDQYLKYDPKLDIVADLQLKKGKNIPKVNGSLDIDKLSVIVEGQRLPNSHAKVEFSGKKTTVNSKLFLTQSSFFQVNGNLGDLKVKSSEINLEDIRKFVDLKGIGLAGIVKADFSAKGEKLDGYLYITDATITEKSLPKPIKKLNVNLKFDNDKVVFEDSSGYFGDIKFNILGNVNSKLISDLKIDIPTIQIKPYVKEIDGVLSAEALIKGDLNKTIEPEVNITGNNLKTPYITTSNLLKVNAKVKPDALYINQATLSSGASTLISARGNVDQFTTLDDIKVNISGLDVNIPELRGSMQVSGDLVLKGKTDAPRGLGKVSLKDVDVPSILFKGKSVDVTLKEDEIFVSTGVVSLNNADFKLVAAFDNKLTPPFHAKTLHVSSDFLDLDKLNAVLAAQPQSPPGSDTPILINDGKFTAKKLIASKLENKDVSVDFTIKPLNVLTVQKFVSHVAGGVATGTANMNLKTSKLNLDLALDKVEVNALATVFANTPNQIFGGMNGRVKLSTIGHTPEAMTLNAIGKADFNIIDGHLGKLGQLSYLLKTGSILSPDMEKTNHFDRLDGHVLIQRGILNIQDISIQGERLSSFISGNITMKNNVANLTVLGKLSGKIVRQLGPIADVSVDKLIRKNLGQFGDIVANTRLSTQYPHRNRIPALNADPDENDRDFAVKINGQIGSPRSVKMLEWL